MSKEQNDRHIIWSNMNLEVDDWRDGYKEYLEINELSDDPNDENNLYEYMVETNEEYLSDERDNLNVCLSQPIIVIGDLGRWNGRVMGYKMIDSGNIIAEPFCDSCDVGSCGFSVIDFILQIFNLRIGNTVFEYTV